MSNIQFTYQATFKTKYLQFILSDRVPTCYLEALERKDFFDLKLDSAFMREKFGSHTAKLNARAFRKALPMIEERYGPDQELLVEILVKHPRVSFGMGDSDINFDATVHMGIKMGDGLNYLVYDEFDFHGEGDMQIDQEVLQGNVNVFEWSKARFSNPSRETPVFDSLDITVEQYTAFWAELDRMASRW